MYILLSNSCLIFPAVVRQQQEEISRNHEPSLFAVSVVDYSEAQPILLMEGLEFYLQIMHFLRCIQCQTVTVDLTLEAPKMNTFFARKFGALY